MAVIEHGQAGRVVHAQAMTPEQDGVGAGERGQTADPGRGPSFSIRDLPTDEVLLYGAVSLFA